MTPPKVDSRTTMYEKLVDLMLSGVCKFQNASSQLFVDQLHVAWAANQHHEYIPA